MGVLLAVTLPAPRTEAAYPPGAEGAAVAVATDNAEATRVALDTMRRGGNAVDGAVAAALALGVVSPSASGLGGGGFALVYWKKEQKVVALDFRESAPAKLDVERLLAARGPGAPNGQRGSAIGVPGEPMGLELLNLRYGKRSLAADALPAADLAARGFAMGKFTSDVMARFRDYVSVSPDLARLFFPGGHPLGYRTLVRRPDLARTLTRFGAEGSKPFYTGDIARKMVAAARASGGALSEEDLAAYRVRERAPLRRSFGARTVYTMPAPSAGGLMLMEALAMYGADRTSALRPMGFGSSEYLHTVAEILRGAVADRARFVGDPDAEPGVADAFERALSREQMAARRAKIAPDKVRSAPEFQSVEHGTTHITVADAEGNVVALTTTVNGPFGARVVAGDTDVLLNDELTDFSSPSDVAGFGVVGLGPNRPRPGARPASSMTPTIVLEDGAPILALGGSGGQRIATGVTQAALARLVFQMDPGACVSAPRVFVTGSSAELFVEPDIAEDVRAGLRARGETLKDETMLVSGVQMVAWERAPGAKPRLVAASDPRKLGLAVAQ